NKPTAPRSPGAAHSTQTNGAAAGGSTAGLHTLTDMEYRQLINLLGSVKMASSQPSDTQPLEGNITAFSRSWILDSGASEHMTGHLELLTNCTPIRGPCPITTANGTNSHATFRGTVSFSPIFKLHNVLYIPGFTCNLISIGKIVMDLNCYVTFRSSQCFFQDLTSKTLIGAGKLQGRVYRIEPSDVFAAATVTNSPGSIRVTPEMWHRRLGHPSHKILHLVSSTLVNKDHENPCDA
ncbi:Unknown protein, partial [Striga hermonthica]